jgi:protein-export membrane protein SecD
MYLLASATLMSSAAQPRGVGASRKDAPVSMNRQTVMRLGLTLATILAAVVFLWPSVTYYSRTPQERDVLRQKDPTILKRIVNLGLDLQGGMRVVLEVDRSSLTAEQQKDVLDRAYTVIENRINGLGVAEPSIQKQGQDRLIVELPGLKDQGAAKNVLGRTAQLQFMLVRETVQLERAVRIIDKVMGGQAITDTAADTTADSTTAKAEQAQTLADKVFGGTTPDTAAAKAGVQRDTTPAGNESDAKLLEGVRSFRELLVAVGEQVGASQANKYRVDAVLRRKSVHDALEKAGLGGNLFLWGHDTTMVQGAPLTTLYYLKGRPEMFGDVIKDAWQNMDQSGLSGGYMIELELNRKGARRFSVVTGANIGRNLAIVLDSTVYSAPQIRSKIPLGRAQITGSFSMEDAKNLAIVLRAGALPAPVNIVEERTVGPSLGQDSIRTGMFAAAIGFALVFLFILVYYRVSGLYANIALILNLFMTLAFMAGINTTLTLPGICSLVLSLGMAVDANVLICERIREELAVGKTIRSAIDAGYRRAFVVIFDSNLTTLITAFILLWLGTGPIKGFAVTLILGLSISMYTALFVTHLMYNMFTPKNATTLSI